VDGKRFRLHLPEQAPRLGEHSAELLRDAGFSDAEIAEMMAKKVSLSAT